MAAALAGLTVIDCSTTMAGAQATQFLADAGADVIQVEPPGGGPLRELAAWPALARGKRSIALDLRADDDRAVLRDLLAGADVLVTTVRPAASRALGLTPDELEQLNPRLISAAITGWGSTGPWADRKGYDGLVLAKLGMFHAKKMITTRPGPAFVSVPFATWGAAQTAVHGILSALIDRESSGRGQHVEADLVRGTCALDAWNWFTEMVGIRWPEAYQVVEAFTGAGEPSAPQIYPLLVAPTKDGVWLQFAQVEPRLMQALLADMGLLPLLADPKWKGFPLLERQELRTELWEIMLAKVGERTLAQWQEVFEKNPDIYAECFRSGPGVLDHRQLVHDGRVVVADDPEFGKVRQPSTLVFAQGKPLSEPRPAPRLDEHGAQLRATVTTGVPVPAAGAGTEPDLPLTGVTILDFGLMFASPYGASMLSDLGARVIKIETLAGDTIRRVCPFPESGAAKVMQGKESIAVDLATEQGREIITELVKRADVVLQSFRAGAAGRVGIDAASVAAINPAAVYVSAPGYGTDGPDARRPAYAPSIGAAIGLSLTDAPDAATATSTLAEVKRASVRLFQAAAVPSAQADGLAALGVASAILLGLLARKRGAALGALTTTMLGTGALALLDQVIDYPGRPSSPCGDPDGMGYHALYRMYPAADGWVFLAAPAEKEWGELVSALADDIALGADDRFGTAEARRANDKALADALAGAFAKRPAQEWEDRLTAADVGCVVVTEKMPEVLLQTDAALAATYATTAMSPVFDEHLRLAPAVRFSRSRTRALGGCLAGDHTDAILREIGYVDDAIADLHDRKIVG